MVVGLKCSVTAEYVERPLGIDGHLCADRKVYKSTPPIQRGSCAAWWLDVASHGQSKLDSELHVEKQAYTFRGLHQTPASQRHMSLHS